MCFFFFGLSYDMFTYYHAYAYLSIRFLAYFAILPCMTIGEWLQTAIVQLQAAQIMTARLDVLVLLEDVLNKERSWLLAHPDQKLRSAQVEKLKSLLLRRISHEPLAYIRGKSEFYGREFAVNAHTLEPRPETETMIELLLKQVKSKKLKVESIVDVGTGSGCIAITAALELPDTKVYATDIDKKCLEVAQVNAKSRGADVTFYRGNLLEPLSTFDFQLSTGKLSILANLPYVPDNHTINQAALHEPRHAIFGGTDGLEYYRELFSQIDVMAQKPTVVLTESLPPQHQTLADIASRSGYAVLESCDFIQCFRQANS